MQTEFWHERWRQNQIGFHQSDVHSLLQRYWPSIAQNHKKPVFVPLCGKSNDMLWLRDQGHTVIGIELSEIAIQDFIKSTDGNFERSKSGELVQYTGQGFCLYVGDFFELRKEHLMGASFVYDRAALIALPPDMRQRYAAHMRTLLDPRVRQLLIALEYDLDHRDGPPFSVGRQEVEILYSEWCEIELLEKMATNETSGPLVDLNPVEYCYRLNVG